MQPSAAQVLTELLSLVSKNVQTWEDLFAEDAEHSSPTLLSNFALSLRGR